MKGTAIICLFVALLAVGGCSKHVKLDYTFRGEAGDWSGEYKTVTTGTWAKRDGSEYFNGSTERTLTITYTYDIAELASKDVVVSYDTDAGAGRRTLNSGQALPPHSFTVLHEKGNDFSIETEDSVIKLTIEVDGEAQALELTYAE